MDVYTIQMMMMSKVSPHCDVQKVKKKWLLRQDLVH